MVLLQTVGSDNCITQQTGTHAADITGYSGSHHQCDDDIQLGEMFYKVTIVRVPVNYFHTKIRNSF